MKFARIVPPTREVSWQMFHTARPKSYHTTDCPAVPGGTARPFPSYLRTFVTILRSPNSSAVNNFEAICPTVNRQRHCTAPNWYKPCFAFADDRFGWEKVERAKRSADVTQERLVI
jgi:hypothetical protein